MRLQPGEHDVDVLGRERVALDVVAVARVVEQGGVDAGEEAVVDHDLLAAPPLLGRGAEEDDLARQLVGDGGQGDGRADARRGHRVVAASVAETRQRVVLGEDPDARAVAAATAATGRPDRRREAARRMLDGEPVTAQDLGDPGRRLVLLEGRLRVGVDPVGEVEDLGSVRLDGGRDAGLEVDLGLGGTDGDTVGHGSSGGIPGGRRRPPEPPADGSAAPCAASAFRRERRLRHGREGRMNSAIGNSRAPCSRSTMKIATISPTQPPRRAARIQSPR